MVENMDEEEYFVQGWLGWDGAPMHVEYITASICLQRANPLSMDDIKALHRWDPVDTPTKQEMQEQAEMDAALVAAEKALEGMGMPRDDDEEEEAAPKFRRNRASVGDSSDDSKTAADSATPNEAAADGKQQSASERRKERRRAADGGAKKSVSFAEDVPG